MKLHFTNKKITGMLTVFPETLSRFEDEVLNPDDPKARRLKSIIGFGSRYRAKENTTMSDLFLYGLRKLISDQKLEVPSIGAIIVVTLCPDYFLPQISSIIHGELGLSENVFCIDIPQACAGFITGMIEAFLLLDQLDDDKKVVLCTGEIFNRKYSGESKTGEPSFGGDVANITIVENCGSGYNDDIFACMKNDGSKRDSLLIEHGAFKNPMTSEIIEQKQNNLPCSAIQMDGSGVFNFVQKEIPPMIKEIVATSEHTIEDIDYFFFHQPNKFMLQKLATALEIPFKKMPMNVTEKYGNSDSGTIPVAITENASDDLMAQDNLCCLSGFGGGLSWGAIVMNIGWLAFCESIVSDL